MESSHDGDQKPVEDGAIEGSAVEAVAELAQVHLHVLGAGSMIGAVDECFCIADDPVQPLEHLAVRIEHLILVNVSFRQRLAIAFICVRLDGGTGSNVLRDKFTHCLLFDVISSVHWLFSGFWIGSYFKKIVCREYSQKYGGRSIRGII